MELREITYVPGLYKIFDEILVNAADNKQRDPSQKKIDVTIDGEEGISVRNDGAGIPVEFHEKEIAHRNLHVDLHVATDMPTIESDRGQLQQVFLNLIGNAFDAVADDGRIEVSIDRLDPDTVSVTVTDDGMGIHKEDIGKIFEPFFTTKKNQGTGLGLSVTYGIVKKLGGQISVESEPGKRTSFTVTLPISRNR